MNKEEIIADFQRIVKEKMAKTGKIDWLPWVFNTWKGFDLHREVIKEEMDRLGIKKATEYAYNFMNNLVEPPKCDCGCNKFFYRFGMGYGATCGSDECRAIKTAIRMTGRVVSQETREKSRIASTGRVRTEESKKLQSERKLQNPNRFWTDEMKAKQSITLKDKFQNDEEYRNGVLEHIAECVELARSDESKEKRKNTMIERYGVDNAGRLVKTLYYSGVSQELFDKIKLFIKDPVECLYATNGGEKRIFHNNTCYFPDFVYKNVIIEFNGDVYHANPEMYKEDDRPNPHHKDKTAKELWDRDEKRLELFRSLGYKVYVVWEKEWHEDNQKVIDYFIKELENI